MRLSACLRHKLWHPRTALIWCTEASITLLLTCRIRVHFYETYNCLWEVRRPANRRALYTQTTPTDDDWKSAYLVSSFARFRLADWRVMSRKGGTGSRLLLFRDVIGRSTQTGRATSTSITGISSCRPKPSPRRNLIGCFSYKFTKNTCLGPKVAVL